MNGKIDSHLARFNYEINKFLQRLTEYGIEYYIVKTDAVDRYHIRFKKGRLRKWHLGLWMRGPWSTYYKTDDLLYGNMICAFLIHSWKYRGWLQSKSIVLSKFSGAIPYDYNEIINVLLEISKFPSPYSWYLFVREGIDSTFIGLLDYFKHWFLYDIKPVIIHYINKIFLKW